MSRTIRRTKEKRLGRSSKVRSYLRTIPDEWNGVQPMHGTVWAFPHVWKEDKEYQEGYWRFHRDSKKYYGWQLLKGGKTSARAHNEKELIKAIKDFDYVPDIRNFIDDRRYHRWANPWDC